MSARIGVLGGSGAMGRAIASEAARTGATVFLVGRNEARLQAVAAELPGDVSAVPGDLTDAEDAKRVFAAMAPLDHAVIATSAGGNVRAGALVSTALDEAQAAFSRLWGAYNAVHLAAGYLRPTGSLVLLSGSSGRRPVAGYGVWSTLHSSLEGLARAAALELAPIRVNVVSPGGIGIDPDRQLAHHRGVPSDVARAVLTLIENQAITGAVLDVDGGERLGSWGGDEG